MSCLLSEREIRAIIREALQEIITTSRLDEPTGVDSPLASTDFRTGKELGSSDTDYSGDDGGDDLDGSSGSVIDIKDIGSFPDIPSEKFGDFISSLNKAGYTNITIVSGMRSVQKQIELVNAGEAADPPARSYHNYGYAIDLNLTSPDGYDLRQLGGDSEPMRSRWQKVFDEHAKPLGISWSGASHAAHFWVPAGAEILWNNPKLSDCGVPGKDWAEKGLCNTPWVKLN